MTRLVRVDRLGGAAYLALGVIGCGGAPGSVVPVGAQPATAEEAGVWVAGTRVAEPTLHRFRFRFRDANSSAGGRGTARITPGDSLRFDVIGPLGAGRAAAFIVGDSTQWAQPEEDVRKLAPNFPLLWAMFGIAQLPADPGAVFRFEDERVTAWRFVAGADTLEYAWVRGPEPRLIADVRGADGRLGRVETVLQADGTLKSSRLDVVRPPARLSLTYGSTAQPADFPPDTWSRPAP